MGDFLDNLAAKSLNQATVLEPRPVSRFEPWQPGGELGAGRPRFDVSPGVERDTDRVEAARPWLPREHDAATPTRLDRLQREAPLAPTLQSFLPPQPDGPAVTLQTVLQPASRNGEARAEAPSVPIRDQSGAVGDERTATEPRAAPLTNPIVQRTEHIEHVIVEPQEPHADAPMAGLRSDADVETSRPPASTAPVIERTERAIIERERATQEHETVPNVVRPAVSSARRISAALITSNIPLYHSNLPTKRITRFL